MRDLYRVGQDVILLLAPGTNGNVETSVAKIEHVFVFEKLVRTLERIDRGLTKSSKQGNQNSMAVEGKHGRPRDLL